MYHIDAKSFTENRMVNHVDVHKLHAKDTIEQTRGYEMKPYLNGNNV